MMAQIHAKAFWDKLQHLVDTSTIIIDRPQNSAHPRFPDIIYPLDYGYMDNTSAGDGEGIDVWIGSLSGDKRIVGAVNTVDLFKRDVELKLLVNCTADEINRVVQFSADNQMGVYLLLPSRL